MLMPLAIIDAAAAYFTPPLLRRVIFDIRCCRHACLLLLLLSPLPHITTDAFASRCQLRPLRVTFSRLPARRTPTTLLRRFSRLIEW